MIENFKDLKIIRSCDEDKIFFFGIIDILTEFKYLIKNIFQYLKVIRIMF